MYIMTSHDSRVSNDLDKTRNNFDTRATEQRTCPLGGQKIYGNVVSTASFLRDEIKAGRKPMNLVWTRVTVEVDIYARSLRLIVNRIRKAAQNPSRFDFARGGGATMAVVGHRETLARFFSLPPSLSPVPYRCPRG